MPGDLSTILPRPGTGTGTHCVGGTVRCMLILRWLVPAVGWDAVIHEPAARSRERNTFRGRVLGDSPFGEVCTGTPTSPPDLELHRSDPGTGHSLSQVPGPQVCSAMAQAEALPSSCRCLESRRQEPALPLLQAGEQTMAALARAPAVKRARGSRGTCCRSPTHPTAARPAPVMSTLQCSWFLGTTCISLPPTGATQPSTDCCRAKPRPAPLETCIYISDSLSLRYQLALGGRRNISISPVRSTHRDKTA